MTSRLLDGKQLSALILDALQQKVSALSSAAIPPKLVIVQVLGDEASSIYVKHKLIAAERVGILAEHVTLAKNVAEAELVETLLRLNADKTVHGILLQLPLPAHLVDEKFLNLIDPAKDVDGLTAINLGCLMQKQPQLMPCTPTGIMRLLQHYELSVVGKEVVIVNASKLVGRPLAMQLLAAGATVTICNSKTKNLAEKVHRAEIIVSATGKAHAINSDWLSPGVVVIDVGVHRHPELGLIGDFDFATAKEIASWITPVPGGVGPMTVAILMENVLAAYAASINRSVF